MHLQPLTKPLKIKLYSLSCLLLLINTVILLFLLLITPVGLKLAGFDSTFATFSTYGSISSGVLVFALQCAGCFSVLPVSLIAILFYLCLFAVLLDSRTAYCFYCQMQ